MVAYLFFWLPHEACGILVSWPGIKPVPPALEAQSLNHWTIRDISIFSFFTCLSYFWLYYFLYIKKVLTLLSKNSVSYISSLHLCIFVALLTVGWHRMFKHNPINKHSTTDYWTELILWYLWNSSYIGVTPWLC